MLTQDLIVTHHFLQRDAFLCQHTVGISRVVAVRLHIAKEQRYALHLFTGLQIVRVTGVGVEHLVADHAADFRVGNDRMAGFSRQGAGDELVMRPLVFILLQVRVILFNHPDADVRVVLHAVNLVEGHPVLHFFAIPGKAGRGETHIEIH